MKIGGSGSHATPLQRVRPRHKAETVRAMLAPPNPRGYGSIGAIRTRTRVQYEPSEFGDELGSM